MPDAAAFLFIHAQTSLHPGTGTALGTVDLPIQRERHTGWPTISGSSLKGVVRDDTRPSDEESAEFQQWLAVFGPRTNEADLHAGALSITDARILAFPVRSAKSVFAWVTCPEALGRLARDAQLAGEEIPFEADDFQVLNEPDRAGLAFASPDTPLAIDEGGQKKLLLEEYDFVIHSDDRSAEAVAKIADWLTDHAVADDFTRCRLPQHLVILSDTEFTHFVRHATEVAARIGLDYQTKTVTGGALFYEEFLPTETLMYAVVLASASRRLFAEDTNGRCSTPMSESDVLHFLTGRLGNRAMLQIGGNETIGKGLCAVRFSTETSPGKDEAK